MFLRETQRLHFLTKILHLTNPYDKLSIFVLFPCLGFPNIYQLTLWDPRLGHLSPSFHMQDGGFGIENMRFNDLSLSLGVIEIQMVLHMLVHGVRFDTV
jgi:hypothetical protein